MDSFIKHINILPWTSYYMAFYSVLVDAFTAVILSVYTCNVIMLVGLTQNLSQAISQ